MVRKEVIAFSLISELTSSSLSWIAIVLVGPILEARDVEFIVLRALLTPILKEGISAYHKLPVSLYLYKTKKVNERKGSIHYTGWRIDRPLPYCRQIGSYFFSSSSWKFSLFIDIDWFRFQWKNWRFKRFNDCSQKDGLPVDKQQPHPPIS